MQITPLDIFEELRFIIELIVAELIFIFPYVKKRDHFLYRFIPTTIFIIFSSFGYFLVINFTKTLMLPIEVGRFFILAWYILLVLLSIVYISFSFDCSIDQAILFASAGYALQHIEYTLVNEMIGIGLYPAIRTNLFLYISLCIVSFGALVTVFYYLFGKRMFKINHIDFPNKKLSSFAYLVLLIFTMFLSFGGQTIFQNGSLSSTVNDPNFLGCSIQIVSCILILIVEYLLFFSNSIANQKAIVDQLLYENKRQFEIKKSSIDIINQKCHDMKHHLAAMKTMKQDEYNESIKKLEKDIMIYDVQIDTGNPVLNTILMDKQLLCLSKDIRMTFLGSASKLSFMDTTDLYTLFGNAIDNAIESVEKLEPSKKSIEIVIEDSNGLTITISNYFDHPLIKNNDIYISSKLDKNYHGFGIKSMTNIVKKYNGHININTEDMIFTLQIII